MSAAKARAAHRALIALALVGAGVMLSAWGVAVYAAFHLALKHW